MCPFGLLPWYNTGVKAMRLGKDGGTFITTPQADSARAITQRVAKFNFVDGVFKGKVVAQFRDQEALWHRLSAIHSDEAERKKDLEDEMKGSLPGNSTVTLAKITNATDAEKPLIVEYDVELSNISSNVGSRLLLPISIFQFNNDNPFQHEKRVHPVYYSYPFQELDEAEFQIPPGMHVENLPAAQKEQTDFGYYDSLWQDNGTSVSVQRRFAILGLLFRTEFYPKLRSFYEKVNTTDKESVVLRAQAAK
jgi:hypothetical protein